MNLNVERRLRKSFMRRLVSTPRGREHVLSLMVAAEEGDESGVFDALATRAEFRRLGDHETADVFDRVAKDEARHVRYCKAIGRRYAEDDAQWAHAVETFARIEDRAFKAVGVTTIAHALETGLLSESRVAKGLGRAMRALDRQLHAA
jgi:rubrerythrin